MVAPSPIRQATDAPRSSPGVQTRSEDERRAADRPDDPRAPYSGYWWSTPALSELRRSIGSLQSTGPVGLHLVEDAFIWRSARCWSLELRPCASIFEIGGTDDWAELVRRYPLAVTKSRRHDWWRATGRDLDWAIPDFHAVASDYDAIHLSVAGYLSTASRAIRAGEAHTVLAGWNPDAQSSTSATGAHRYGPHARPPKRSRDLGGPDAQSDRAQHTRAGGQS